MANPVSPALAAPRVDLMPRSEIVRRERDKLTRAWVWGVFGAILIAILLIAAAFWLKLSADQRLATEQARTNQLLLELAALSDVSQALATESELTDFRSEAMATDLAWTPVFQKVVSVLPADTVVIGFDLTTGGAPTGEDPTAELGLVGTVTFDSPTPIDVVPLIRSLRAVEGIYYADGQSVTSTQTATRYTYLLTVWLDQTVYSGEYAASEGSPN